MMNPIKIKKMSVSGLELLSELEGSRKKPYDDQTGKTITQWCRGATIGIGHLISKDEWDKFKNGISESDIIVLLAEDVIDFEEIIFKEVKPKLNQNQFNALCLLVFNIGAGHFVDSSVLKMINNAEAVTNYNSIESAWKAWNKSQGKVMQGLINRREKEWDLYNK